MEFCGRKKKNKKEGKKEGKKRERSPGSKGQEIQRIIDNATPSSTKRPQTLDWNFFSVSVC